VIGTSSTDRWHRCVTEVLGAMAEGEGPELIVRIDDHMARLIIEPGEDRLVALAWEVAGRVEWDDLLARLDAAGLAVEQLAREDALGSRFARHVCRTSDPSGNTIEFALAPLVEPVRHFVSPTGAAFVTGEQGMGHVTMGVAQYVETVDFYTRVLGFHVRDTKDVVGGSRATFAGCNSRQHSIALIDGQGRNFLHHIMVEVDSLDTVGRAMDRARTGEHGVEMSVSLGRHWNDGMTSFYMTSPSGFQIEYGYGGLRVDPERSSEVEQGGVGKGSYWGHYPA
jgi:2,3-dihydroxybiphenyl 1,2-dioxygenase